MKSQIVVISWWSNSLGLECLRRLAGYLPDRRIYVVQVGKSREQKQRFREALPDRITELLYPDDAPGEHSRVVYEIALNQLYVSDGVWFIDHDVFFEESCAFWFDTADQWFTQSYLSLCVNAQPGSPALTQPAFWISPARWPAHITTIDPVPFEARESSRRPDLFRHSGGMSIPQKDTLVQSYEELTAIGQGERYLLDTPSRALPPFPKHTHLGGLYLLAGPMLPPDYHEWMKTTVSNFVNFYAQSPDSEDPELLRRLREFQEVLGV